MGHIRLWDGHGLPDIGDEILYEVASKPNIQRGKVTRFEVDRVSKNEKGFCWRIRVFMDCVGMRPGTEFEMCRALEDVHPLTWKKD
jgi:hypothetical protein